MTSSLKFINARVSCSSECTISCRPSVLIQFDTCCDVAQAARGRVITAKAWLYSRAAQEVIKEVFLEKAYFDFPLLIIGL
jgi:hypothetical protein